jgi:hypothetical protein
MMAVATANGHLKYARAVVGLIIIWSPRLGLWEGCTDRLGSKQYRFRGARVYRVAAIAHSREALPR